MQPPRQCSHPDMLMRRGDRDRPNFHDVKSEADEVDMGTPTVEGGMLCLVGVSQFKEAHMALCDTGVTSSFQASQKCLASLRMQQQFGHGDLHGRLRAAGPPF